jgi:hypothetical protein
VDSSFFASPPFPSTLSFPPPLQIHHSPIYLTKLNALLCFQPAVRSELFVTELDRKLSLDHPPQPPYLQPHLWGLSCRLELRCCRTPNDAPAAPFLRSNRRIDQNYFRFKVSPPYGKSPPEEKTWLRFSFVLRLPASNKPDAAVSPTNGTIAEPRADRRDYGFDEFFRRPGRGRRALSRAAIFFLRLLTKPPLRPFSRLARCLASLRTSPPNLPRATA